MITRSVHTIFFFLVTSFLTTGKSSCPLNCVCILDRSPRSVLCANQQFEEFPEGISDLVEFLDVSKNNVELISADIGRLTELQQLVLSRNELRALPNELQNLVKVEKLDLSDNYITDINGNLNVISSLSNLQLLHIRNNPISNLDELKNPSLRALDISQCLITHLTNATLLGLPQLVSLNLNGNPLKSVDHMNSQKLKWLDLSNCMLNYLYPNTFHGAPELEQLRIANNPVLVFSSRKETLRHDKLRRLDVSGCNLDRPGIHGLPSLTHVLLSRNVIRLLPDRIFARNKMLIHLNLSGNGLTQFNQSSFAGMPNLEVLDLSSNNVETLPWTMVKDNIYLRVLNLSSNNIKNFPTNFTTTALMIDLSYNLIEHVSKESLTYMPRIKSLNLSKNRLETFSSGVESLTLKALILEGNRLVRLSNQSFVFLPSLTGIDLSGNRLTEAIALEVFQYNQDLHTIRLHDNPWRCDCQQLYSLYYYLTLSSKTNPSTLICESPHNLSGYTWATACQRVWGDSENRKEAAKTERTYGLVLMALLMTILVFGSIVSIGHTIKEKRRQAVLRIRESERAEARERLLLHRRNQLEEARRQENIPRVHPEELIRPPTYEEAVQMPRLVRSLDNLNSISTEGLGQSSQSLDREALARKRRRQQRKRALKGARSEDTLESRHEDRLRSSDRTTKKSKSRSATGSQRINAQSNTPIKSSTPRRPAVRARSSESEEPNNSRNDTWNRTLRTRSIHTTKHKRTFFKKDGHSSDDEDSDVLKNQATTSHSRRNVNVNVDNIQVIELPREPRSGTYRPPPTLSASPVSLVSTPEPCETVQEISASRIV